MESNQRDLATHEVTESDRARWLVADDANWKHFLEESTPERIMEATEAAKTLRSLLGFDVIAISDSSRLRMVV